MYILQAVNTILTKNVLHFPRQFLAIHEGETAMQVDCPECYGTAIIHSRKQLDIKMSKLYCSCKNPLCGHTFVMDLSFSHTLSPSGKQADNLILNMLKAMPIEQRELLIQAAS